MEDSQYGKQVKFEVNHVIADVKTSKSHISFVETRYNGRVLLMDGEVQLSSQDEYRYHEMLVHPVMAHVGVDSARVLVLGGGDGCAVREILKWHNVGSVTVVDYDEEFVDTFGKGFLVDLNKHAFTRSGVKYICSDAMEYLVNTRYLYDAIFIDLPDPDGAEMECLYLNLIRASRHCLAPGGGLGMHVGPAIIDTRYPGWETIKQCSDMLTQIFTGFGPDVQFRTCYVPSFSNEWGFLHMTLQNGSTPNTSIRPVCKYLTVPSDVETFYLRLV
jgi:spermidine synthase